MSKPQGGGSFFETIARFVVDRRNLIFFLYIVAAIFSVISSRWVGVNNDITDYLSEDTETRKGLDSDGRRDDHLRHGADHGVPCDI